MSKVKFKSKEDRRRAQKSIANSCYKKRPIRDKNDKKVEEHHIPGLAFYKSRVAK